MQKSFYELLDEQTAPKTETGEWQRTNNLRFKGGRLQQELVESLTGQSEWHDIPSADSMEEALANSNVCREMISPNQNPNSVPNRNISLGESIREYSASYCPNGCHKRNTKPMYCNQGCHLK